MEDDREQFNNYISKRVKKDFKDIVNRKYGYYAKNMWSFEVEKVLKYYISMSGILPETSHTHISHQNQNIKYIPKYVHNKNEKMETTAIVTRTQTEDYHKRPIVEDPILMPYLLKIGIDFNDMDNTISQLNEEDMRVDKLHGEELKQWEKNSHDIVVMKLRRCYDNQRLAKVAHRDKQLESELGQIKQHLNDTDSIREQNKIHEEQIYKAYVVVTGKRDDRPFKRRLHEYADSGYITLIDDKHKVFRAEEKFLAI